MITYKEKTKIGVYVDNTYTGNIVNAKDGYQYIPKGSKVRGALYQSIDDVKLSLERED